MINRLKRSTLFLLSHYIWIRLFEKLTLLISFNIPMVVEMTKSCLSKSQFTLGLQLSKLMKISPVYVTVWYERDRRALNLFFKNLSNLIWQVTSVFINKSWNICIVMVIIYFSYLRYFPLIGVCTGEAEYKKCKEIGFY